MRVSYSCLVEVESLFSESAASAPLGSGPKAIVVVYDIFGFTTQAKQVRWSFSSMLHDACTLHVWGNIGRFNAVREGMTLFSKGAHVDEAFLHPRVVRGRVRSFVYPMCLSATLCRKMQR